MRGLPDTSNDDRILYDTVRGGSAIYNLGTKYVIIQKNEQTIALSRDEVDRLNRRMKQAEGAFVCGGCKDCAGKCKG